jgi:peptide/nickel transport system permease protein
VTRRYVAGRLLQILAAIAAIVIISFGLIHLAPGDAVGALAGEYGDAEYYAFMREKFGLDRSLPDQFLTYAGNILRGDLGVSFVHGRPVAEVIGERLPATLMLMVTAIILSTLAGIGLGAMSARRPFGPFDLGVSVACLIGYATPSFLLAQVALLTLAFYAGLFPIHGMTDPRIVTTGLAHITDVAHHLVLPAMVLATQQIALTARLTRAGIIEASGRDFIRTARATGLSQGQALRRHALPNALLPVVTIIGGRVGFLFSGAVLTEIVFAWPGIGRLMLSSLQTRDHPVLLGILLMVAFAVVVANLLTDLIYAWLDPRIRYN